MKHIYLYNDWSVFENTNSLYRSNVFEEYISLAKILISRSTIHLQKFVYTEQFYLD